MARFGIRIVAIFKDTMKRSRSALILLCLINFTLFISCTKEENDNNRLPSVDIIYPLENSMYSNKSVIPVVATITDDMLIRSVKVSLKDLNNVPVLTRDIPGIDKKTYDLSIDLEINDSKLDGTYYIDVQAFDDTDFGSGFVYVNIAGEKDVKREFLIFTEDGSNTNYYKYDSVVTFKKAYTGDLLESAWNKKNNQTALCGRFTGDLISIDTSGKIIWSHPNPAIPSAPYFNDLLVDDGNTFASLEEGKILGFDEDGNRFFEEVLSNEFRITAIHRYKDRFIYIKERKLDGQRWIRHVYYPSGQVIDERIFDHGAVTSMHGIGDKIMLFCYDEPVQKIIEYDVNIFSMIKRESLSGTAKVRNSIDLDGENIIYSINEEIMQYNFINGGSLERLDNLNATCLKNDVNTQTFWLSEEASISIIETSSQPWLKFQSLDLQDEIDGDIKSFEIFFIEKI